MPVQCHVGSNPFEPWVCWLCHLEQVSLLPDFSKKVVMKLLEKETARDGMGWIKIWITW